MEIRDIYELDNIKVKLVKLRKEKRTEFVRTKIR